MEVEVAVEEPAVLVEQVLPEEVMLEQQQMDAATTVSDGDQQVLQSGNEWVSDKHKASLKKL